MSYRLKGTPLAFWLCRGPPVALVSHLGFQDSGPTKGYTTTDSAITKQRDGQPCVYDSTAISVKVDRTCEDSQHEDQDEPGVDSTTWALGRGGGGRSIDREEHCEWTGAQWPG